MFVLPGRKKISLKNEYYQYDIIDKKDISFPDSYTELKQIFIEKDDGYHLDNYCGKLSFINYEIIIRPALNADLNFMVNYLCKHDGDCLQGECMPLLDTMYRMDMLFECYARTVIKKVLEDICFCDKQAKNPLGEAAICYLQSKPKEKLMVPDIVIEKDGSCVIFDVKFKDGYKKHNIREDRLQILAYALMWNCKRIGHIFPSTDGEFKIKKTEIMRKNSDKDVYIQMFIPTNKKLCESERLKILEMISLNE